MIYGKLRHTEIASLKGKILDASIEELASIGRARPMGTYRKKIMNFKEEFFKDRDSFYYSTFGMIAIANDCTILVDEINAIVDNYGGRSFPGLITNSIRFCWLFAIKNK